MTSRPKIQLENQTKQWRGLNTIYQSRISQIRSFKDYRLISNYQSSNYRDVRIKYFVNKQLRPLYKAPHSAASSPISKSHGKNASLIWVNYIVDRLCEYSMASTSLSLHVQCSDSVEQPHPENVSKQNRIILLFFKMHVHVCMYVF